MVSVYMLNPVGGLVKRPILSVWGFFLLYYE